MVYLLEQFFFLAAHFFYGEVFFILRLGEGDAPDVLVGERVPLPLLDDVLPELMLEFFLVDSEPIG